ncbi:sulfatase-like hydrolase/transferase [Crateriforma spongiae]|uniref:sulfatase-like hydrolase/transferase n=1 Tax=Crateriforma spongiae TaxID=2724528 RepID=UPI0039B064D0
MKVSVLRRCIPNGPFSAGLRGLALLLLLAATADAAGPARPNIVLIMADDLGVECLGSYGGTSYATPNLDELAGQGIRFSNAHAQPLCTNTRVQLMTGLYNNRNWQAFGILDRNSQTIGHYMSDAGYQTCIAGKWQLYSYDPPDYPGAAMRRGTGMRGQDAGFDEYSLWHNGHTEDKGSRYADPVIEQNGAMRTDTAGQYGPDLWVDYICDFIDRKQSDDQPFFVYYPMALPHGPMTPTPISNDWQDPSKRHDDSTDYFADMVQYTDRCVGRVVDKIDQLGLAEQTLIIFYSDNGTHQSITSNTDNGPIRGGKGLTTDAGTHVPLIVRWSGVIQPGEKPHLVDSTDFLPTVLDAAGKPETLKRTDGVSFLPVLMGDDTARRDWIFCHYDPRPGWDKDQFSHARFARDHRYKLYGDGQFFDLEQDPLEQSPINLGTEDDERVATRLRLQSVLDQMPNPEPMPRDPLAFSASHQEAFFGKSPSMELLWGEGKFTEGPTVTPDGDILFSDVRAGRVMHWNHQTSQTSILIDDLPGVNGLASIDSSHFYACRGGGRRALLKVSFEGKVDVIADRFEGKRFNSPNDVVIDSDGALYFTDPRYGDQSDRELDHEGVYRVEDGKVTLATDQVQRPNGLAFSKDESHLFVADNNNDYGGARTLLSFDRKSDGSLDNRKVVYDFGMGRRGIDGMCVDQFGNVYATAGKGNDAGVYVFGPDGEQLAVLPVPDVPTNCCLMSVDDQTFLLVTCQTARGTCGLFRAAVTPVNVQGDSN